jgi:hypothetical protein
MQQNAVRASTDANGGKFPVRRAGDNVELGDRRNLDGQFDFQLGWLREK